MDCLQTYSAYRNAPLFYTGVVFYIRTSQHNIHDAKMVCYKAPRKYLTLNGGLHLFGGDTAAALFCQAFLDGVNHAQTAIFLFIQII